MYQERRVNKLLKEDFYRVASGTWSSSISLVRELLIKPEEHIEPGKYWKYPAPHSAWKDRQASLMCEVYSISLSFIHKIVAKNFKHVCHLPTKNLRGVGGGDEGGGVGSNHWKYLFNNRCVSRYELKSWCVSKVFNRFLNPFALCLALCERKCP